MTDLAPIKTLLVAALNASLIKDNDFSAVYFVSGASERYDYDYDAKGEIGLEIEDSHYDMTIDADRLATTIHDHYASALVEALKIKAAFNWPDEALPKLFSDCADGTMVRLRGNIASLSRFGGSQ